MWNALAGFGGLISVGQQVFFGLGAYFTIRIADAGIDPFFAILLAAVVVGVLSLPLSLLMLRLRGGEFAIGMWVIAELAHLLHARLRVDVELPARQLRREAHYVQNEMVKGEWTDELVYAMLEDEWRSLQRRALSWGLGTR